MDSPCCYLPREISCPLNPNYQAILYVQERVKKKNINHELRRYYDGWNLVLLNKNNNIVGNIMEHYFSEGLEASGFPECGEEEAIGYLNVEEALKLFIDNSKKKNNSRLKHVLL